MSRPLNLLLIAGSTSLCPIIFIFLNQLPLTHKPFLACMQMPHVGELLTDVPKHSQLYKNADNINCSGMVDMVNLLHPSIGVKNLRLKWKKFKHFAGHVGGARNIFCELFGQDKAENTFWLDSSSIEKVCCFLSNYCF